MIWREPLSFSVTVDGVVVVGCKVMVLELDSSIGGCFYLEVGVKE